MKPPLFRYAAPRSIEEAVELLSGNTGAAVLAGGQSLIPAMNMRLASPSMLVDIQHIAALNSLSIVGEFIVVGAMVRHRTLELDRSVHAANPLIREVLGNVAHVPIRHRGTIVGSLCHGDAAAELPLLLLLCNGSVTCVSRAGRREVAAADFFEFHLSTSRRPDELAVEARFCTLPPGTGYAFAEFARRHGDYALASAGCLLKFAADGSVERVRLVAGGIGPKPTRLLASEELLKGKVLDDRSIKAAADAARAEVIAEDDFHASRQYRQRLIATLVKRTVLSARERTRQHAVAA